MSKAPAPKDNAKPEAFDSKNFLKNLTGAPGIYKMLNAEGAVLYVGKARNLKNRVSSYFRSGKGLTAKTMQLMAQVADIEIIVTHTETEALILENNLIKSELPRYNILLRDDKSYPYIYLSTEHEFPRLELHRGARRGKGKYFGPYPGVGAVRETLNLMQKLFRVRQCEDSFFKNRSRPCLQYQIKRCSGPCVGHVSEADYAEDVQHVSLLLSGRSDEVVEAQVKQMEGAAKAQEYERAARLRDQVSRLRQVVEHQYVDTRGGNIDLVAVVLKEDVACVQVLFIRDGRMLGNKSFFPKQTRNSTGQEVMDAFLSQYYLGDKTDRAIANYVLVNVLPEERDWLNEAITDRAGHKVSITKPARGDRARWMRMAVKNAEVTLGQRLSNRSSQQRRVESLQEFLQLEELPQRFECFDISHTQGEATVASCVVFNHEGAVKSDYRRFNINSVEDGDDYAAMHEVLLRRYTRIRKEEGRLPDVIFVDGGKGQVAQAQSVLAELQITDPCVVGIAKGPGRKPGLESLFLSAHGQPRILPPDSPALHFVQEIRDEAHRFAITGHRQRRARSRNRSVLEDISGIGAKRRQALIHQFGGLQGVSRAGIDDLTKIDGISQALAQRIYDAFHDGT